MDWLARGLPGGLARDEGGMKMNAKGLHLTALAAASGDRCPHWVSVMPLVPSDAETIAADAVL